jgi:hypothetical protein
MALAITIQIKRSMTRTIKPINGSMNPLLALASSSGVTAIRATPMRPSHRAALTGRKADP